MYLFIYFSPKSYIFELYFLIFLFLQFNSTCQQRFRFRMWSVRL